MPTASTLIGRRVLLRPLGVEDFDAWHEVRARNTDWLIKWEPMRTPGSPDPVQNRDAFAVRCGARQRERQLGTGFGYGIFVEGHFAGEINLSIVQRGPFPRPRDRCRQSRAEPDPIGETAQGVQPGVGHNLCSAGFHPNVQRTVTVHFASALLAGVLVVSQHQEKQARRAFPRIRVSTHLRHVND